MRCALTCIKARLRQKAKLHSFTLMTFAPNPSESLVTAEATIEAIVLARPILKRLFEVLGIDHRIEKDLPLRQVCANLGLDVATTIILVQSAATALEMPPEINAEDMTITQLADHIENTHHAYVKKEIPRLFELARAVVSEHGECDPRLLEMETMIHVLADEFKEHMLEEEAGLFPFMRRAEAGTANYVDGSILDDTIGQMEAEHEETNQAVARLRDLSDGFAPQEWSSKTHHAFLAALVAFEADLKIHVHKENDILFPRTFALASL